MQPVNPSHDSIHYPLIAVRLECLQDIPPFTGLRILFFDNFAECRGVIDIIICINAD